MKITDIIDVHNKHRFLIYGQIVKRQMIMSLVKCWNKLRNAL